MGTTVIWMNSYTETTIVGWHWFILSIKVNLKQAATHLSQYWFLALAPVLSQLELQSFHAKSAMQLNEQMYSS